MISPATYWRTIRHLRREQLVARLWRFVPKVPIRTRPAPPVRTPQESFRAFIRRPGPIRRGNCFRLLNQSRKVVTSADWDRSDQAKLWTYNLHYFEWLREAIASERVADDAAWLDRWISENPVGRTTGWEPYPLSLRAVNWIMWFLTFGHGTRAHLDSLATQVRH